MSKRNVVAIGVFDGVHLGHSKILKEAANIARRNKTKSIAVTFNPHPVSVLKPKIAPPSLISLQHRLKLMRSLGIDRCIVVDFTKEFSRTAPLFFIENMLLKKLKAGWVVVGEDFCFGKNKQADVGYLKEKAGEFGFKVASVKPLRYKGLVISSSLIRRKIQFGDLGFAEKLLGRKVAILGTVVKGNELGQKLGFPTANINPHHKVVPPSGVYAVYVKLGKKRYSGILNIGTRPTFYGISKEDQEPFIEVHIFDFSKNIYGKDIEVEFMKRLRSEKRFLNKEKLIEQIEKDIKETKQILIKPEGKCHFI